MTKRIAVIGAGAAGLLTAQILARAGHSVVVLERDASWAPDDDEAAWDDWDRPGVNQLRQPHGLMPGGLQILSDELPELAAELEATDSVVTDIAAFAPASVDIANLPDLRILGIRRTTFERRLRNRALASENLEILWDSEPLALTVDTTTADLPIVRGIEISAGHIAADLVVDASGRRTSTPDLLDAHNIPYRHEKESDGFTYFTRWFRVTQSLEGVPIGLAGMAPGIECIQFPSDGRTVGIALVGSMKDKPVRAIRDSDTFMRVAESAPALAELLSGAEAITDVTPMGSIQNRYLRFAHNGIPSVAGFVCIGDSAVSTNPTLGRGISLAARSAVHLRDILVDDPGPAEVAHTWESRFDHDILAWLTDAIHSDRRIRAVFDAARMNEPIPDAANRRTTISRAAGLDPDIWTRWIDMVATYTSPAEILNDDGLYERARELESDVPPPEFLMNRDELEQLLTT